MISSLSLLPNLSFFSVFLFQWLMISDCKKLKTCIRLSISLSPFLFISHQMPTSVCQFCHFNSFRIRPSSYPFLQFFIISCITLNSPVFPFFTSCASVSFSCLHVSGTMLPIAPCHCLSKTVHCFLILFIHLLPWILSLCLIKFIQNKKKRKRSDLFFFVIENPRCRYGLLQGFKAPILLWDRSLHLLSLLVEPVLKTHMLAIGSFQFIPC